MEIPLLNFETPSDDEELEPPFEIHGMTNTNENKVHAVQIESDDDGDDVPPSILFEAQDDTNLMPGGLPPRQYDLSASTNRVQHRRRSAVRVNHQIAGWIDVHNMDEFLTRVQDVDVDL